MGIIAKHEMIIRFTGAIIFLLGVIFTIIIDLILLENIFSNITLLLIVVILFLFSFSVKLDLSFTRRHILLNLIFVSSICLLLLIFGSIFIQSHILVIFLLISVSNIIAIISWHFSLSLYKKKKIIFVVGCLIYVLLSLLLRIGLSPIYSKQLVGILPLFLIIIGMMCILISERLMMKKGILKYI